MQLEKETPYWLVLHRTRGIGGARFARLLERQKPLSDFFSDLKPTAELQAWLKGQGIDAWEPDWQGVERDLTWAEGADHHILLRADPRYPVLLNEIASAPPLLFVRGSVSVLSQPQMAFVGSRHPTIYGKKAAFDFASALAAAGLVITSGLALGIDAASHEGALAQQGQSIAVLGNGLDTVYPKRHYALASRLATQGAVISEFPIGSPPLRENFPRRNRLISGLSHGVFVVESTLKSGSLITASYALEQGREIFTLPGSMHSPLSKGCHYLIRQGAKCVDAVEHILEELTVPLRAQSVAPPFQPQTTKEKSSSEFDQLLVYVNEVCTSIDEIVDQTGLTASKVSPMLLALELAGKIGSVPGGYIRLTTGGSL